MTNSPLDPPSASQDPDEFVSQSESSLEKLNESSLAKETEKKVPMIFTSVITEANLMVLLEYCTPVSQEEAKKIIEVEASILFYFKEIKTQPYPEDLEIVTESFDYPFYGDPKNTKVPLVMIGVPGVAEYLYDSNLVSNSDSDNDSADYSESDGEINSDFDKKSSNNGGGGGLYNNEI